MDMSQYLDMFLEESYENLQNLNEDILGLEKNPEDKDLINAIFRAAHTLKGMAGSMGFSDIAELTHKMENVLDKFRNDELKVTSEVITILFRCLDTLEKMISNIQNGSNEIIDINEIMLQLQSIVDSKNTDKIVESKKLDDFKLNEYDINIVKQAYEKGYKVYKVDVELIKDCILKSARAFLVYKTLESAGEIVKSSPSIEDIEQENFELTFSIVVISDNRVGAE